MIPLSIAVSAALGALLRWQLGSWLNPLFPTLPLGTLCANLIGGLLMGVAMELIAVNAGIPPAVAQQVSAIAHDVFVSAYIDAMKHTMIVPIVFLAFTALTALLIKRRARPAAAEQPREEYRAAAS